MAGVEGEVTLKITLDKDGTVLNVEVLNSPNKVFSRAAMEAAQKSRYSPAYQHGKQVKVWISQTYHFRLGG
jgi:TonB family protein